MPLSSDIEAVDDIFQEGKVVDASCWAKKFIVAAWPASSRPQKQALMFQFF